MTRTKSRFEVYHDSIMSQRVSKDNPILEKLSGTDRELSDSIAVITYLGEQGIMNKEDTKFILGLLDVLRLSHLATSETTNEITKLGFMLPKGTNVVDFREKPE